MSYNFARRQRRAHERILIEEFKKEAGLSSKQLDRVLVHYTHERVKSLADRFKKMINLAMGKYRENELPDAPKDVVSTAAADIEFAHAEV